MIIVVEPFHMDLSSNLDLANPLSLANNTLMTNVLKGIGISRNRYYPEPPLERIRGD